MFAFIAVSVILVPLFFLSDPHWGAIGYHFVVPSIQGGASSTAVLLIIAIVGTTVAPWQLFFQQSNVIDKRITPRFIPYERADTTLGAFVVVISAAMILAVGVFAVRGTNLVGKFTDALGVANALAMHGRWYGALFSIVLLDASIIGASAVTLSTSYAFGDVFGIKHSLHRKFREAKPFYTIYAAMIVASAGIVLIPGAPLGLLTEAVQALAGILLPSASVFLLLLCNDREVLGPWMNPRWLNMLSAFIIGVLLVLSGTLVVDTLFSQPARPEDRDLDSHRAGGRGLRGWSLVLAHQEPAPGAPAAPARHHVRRGTRELAHAAARAAQAGGVVLGKEDRPAAASRLPRDLRPAADRQGCPAGLKHIRAQPRRARHRSASSLS